jgi:hypothetical protein
MKYVVYCDESRYDGQSSHMGIGGLWVPADRKVAAVAGLRAILAEEGLGAEVKWHKVSRARLDSYRRLVDFFFDNADLAMRVIVVDLQRIDYDRFHNSDPELGFYKFYYEMLEKWLFPQDEYLLLLDHKHNRDAKRHVELRKVLRNSPGVGTVLDVNPIDSSQTPLAQMADLLTGAVAAAWSGGLAQGSAKQELAAHIAQRSGRISLLIADGSPAFCKFNIFHIGLR